MKFNFEKSCASMLLQMGATPVEYHVPRFEIQTIAGTLGCTPYDNWLACRFDDVAAAKKHIMFGQLNPFSGKWNWHFSKPSQRDVDYLQQQIVRILIQEPTC